MFVTEITTRRDIGNVTDVYHTEGECEFAEWDHGLVVQAVGELFVYTTYDTLVSVVVQEEEDVEDATEG